MAASWPAIFQQAPAGTVITEGTCHVVRYANPEFCRFVGVSCEHLLGREIAEVVPENMRHPLVSLLDQVSDRHLAASCMGADVVGDATTHWMAVSWSLGDRASDSPRPALHITHVLLNVVPTSQYDDALAEIRAINTELVLSNLRAQELLEDAELASQAKDQFLAMLGHELRNPLTPIRTSVEILRRIEHLDPVVVEAREMIARQTTHMVRLIDDLLDVSRLAHGKISLRKERLDVVEVVRRTIQDQRPALDAADLSLNLVLPAQPVWIVGDRTRLAQIITNILHNAVKFTEPKGRIDVRVTAEPDSAIISIRDTGIGMAPDMARAAFELFRQADNTLSRSRGGLGVGLSLAKGLVALHQGDIRAASEGLGKGSELTVRLPLTHPPEPPRDRPTIAGGRIPGSRVLLVEDNVDAAESMRVLLQLGGHHVEVVHNGNEALPLAREFHPEVVLCDIGLPGLDGYAVARAIREDPSVPTPHMIAITGYGRDEDVRLALEAGFDQHLTKPVDFARLDELLAQRT